MNQIKTRGFQQGFTLVELMVSLGILGIVGVLIVQLLVGSTQASRLVYSSSQMQQELRTAASIIGDEIQRSVYIFPPQGSTIDTVGGTVTVNWSSFNLGAGNKKTGPHESTTFVVTNPPTTTKPPILAMITAPINPAVSCMTSDTSGVLFENSAATPRVQPGDGCFKFIAYYPVIRPKVTRGGLLGNSATSNALLDVSEADVSRWVVMEFRMNLTGNASGVPWNRVGCDKRSVPCSNPPTIDPIRSNPDLPVLTCTIACNTAGRPLTTEATAFQTRINATVTWINTQNTTVNAISPEILMDNIDESYADSGPGFVVRMSADTLDARGVTQVRLQMRARTGQDNRRFGTNSGTTVRPISFFFTPRNIAALKP